MENCIFCKIINHEISSEIVAEEKNYIVIKDITPKAPVHLLILSKKHIPCLLGAGPEDKDLLGSMLLATRDLAAKFDVDKRGYKTVINCGREGGQVVDHLHIHFLAGQDLRGHYTV